MDITCYYDNETGKMKTRPCTPEEQAEIDAARAAGPSVTELNAPILAALVEIDAKSIRPLCEGDTLRVAALEAEAATLRAKLVKG